MTINGMLREATTTQPPADGGHDDLSHYRARVSAALLRHAENVKNGVQDGLIGGEWVYPLPRTFDAFARTMTPELRGRFRGAWWPVGAAWTTAGWEHHYALATRDDFDVALNCAVVEHWEAIVDMFADDIEKVGR